MSTLTDTQLVILSAASQRDDRGVELSANIKGEAARKAAECAAVAIDSLLSAAEATGKRPARRAASRGRSLHEGRA
jgi:hypothetical protein